MVSLELLAGAKSVGAKETLKALDKNIAVAVFIAKDAESRVTCPVRSLALSKAIPVVEVDAMSELGAACGLFVGAAAAAALKSEQD